ncbi:hypothetical protein [Veronia nyctiphanis]|uniref:hypothetical protein n=1 Tax=Veronia nyctiphanis TaxID=1278244 RepID=UPI001375E082|nr:hypothetical protein [Veronia nyctiphanis]
MIIRLSIFLPLILFFFTTTANADPFEGCYLRTDTISSVVSDETSDESSYIHIS